MSELGPSHHLWKEANRLGGSSGVCRALERRDCPGDKAALASSAAPKPAFSACWQAGDLALAADDRQLVRVDVHKGDGLELGQRRERSEERLDQLARLAPLGTEVGDRQPGRVLRDETAQREWPSVSKRRE